MLMSHRSSWSSSSFLRFTVVMALAGSAGCQSAGMNPMLGRSEKAAAAKQMAARTAQSDPSVVMNSQGKPASSAQIIQEKLRSAETHLSKGNYGQAQQDYEAVIGYRPDHAEANHGLAIIADQQGQYQLAEQYYMTALRSDSRNADLLSNMGYSYLLQKKYAQSEEYLRKALESEPKHRKASINLGDLYAQAGDPDRAIAMYRNVSSEADAQAHLKKVLTGAANPTMLAKNETPPTNQRTQKILEEMAAARQSEIVKHRANQTYDQRADRLADAQMTAQAMQDWELKQRLMSIDNQEPKGQSFQQPNQQYANNVDRPQNYSQPSMMNAPNPYSSQQQQQYSMQTPQDQRLPRPEPMAPYQQPNPQQLYANQQNSPMSYPESRPAYPDQQQGFQNANYQQMSNMNPQAIQQASGYMEQPMAQQQSNNPFSTPWNVSPSAQGYSNMPLGSMPQDPSSTSNNNRPLNPSMMPAQGQRAPQSTSVRDQMGTPPNVSSNSANAFEAAQMKAMQMGMNAGPGQMFPLDNYPSNQSQNGNPNHLSQSSPSMQNSSASSMSAPPQSPQRSLPGSDSYLGANIQPNWNRLAPDLSPQQNPNSMQQAVYNKDYGSGSGSIQQLGGNIPSRPFEQQTPSTDAYQQQMQQHQQNYQQLYQNSALSPQATHQPSSQQYSMPASGMNRLDSNQQQPMTWQDHIYRQRGDGQYQNPGMENQQNGMPPQQSSNMQQSLPQWNHSQNANSTPPQWNPNAQNSNMNSTYNNASSMANPTYPPAMQQGIGAQLPVISPSSSQTPRY